MSRLQAATKRSAGPSIVLWWLRPALPGVILLMVWQALSISGVWPPSVLPSPMSVIEGLGELFNDRGLMPSLALTVYRVLIGGLGGLLIGLIAGAVVASSRRLSNAVEPVTSFFQSIGEVGWLPVLILWLGFNDLTIIVTVAYTTFFPVYFGTVAGFEGIPRNLSAGVFTLGGNRLDVIRQVMVPGALPAIITGFRTGIGFGWRTVILAELLIGGTGLGVLLFDGREAFRPDWIMAEMVVIGAVWLVFDRFALMPLERNTVERWGLVR